MANDFLKELKEINEWILHVRNQMDALGVELKKEFSIAALKDQLLTLPGQIKKTQIVALQKRGELAEFEQQQMKQREAEILFEINGETGITDEKPRFSNEPVRKAELIRRLGKDEQYSALKKQRSAIEFKLWESEAEVDRLRNEFRSRLAIKDLIVAELNLYTK